MLAPTQYIADTVGASPEKYEPVTTRILEMFTLGYTQDAIASELDIPHRTVATALAKVKQRWQKIAATSLDAAIGREVAVHDLITVTAWERYGQEPDPEYLKIVLRAAEIRARVQALPQRALTAQTQVGRKGAMQELLDHINNSSESSLISGVLQGTDDGVEVDSDS